MTNEYACTFWAAASGIAGAVAVAAAMFNKVPVEGKKVVCVVSGGNIDVNILDRVIKRGLLTSGRSALLKVELLDKTGLECIITHTDIPAIAPSETAFDT